ncbi:hypothetical protein QJS10_CPB19g00340 [Acorus calamus]|uniref:Uncharacterized protein n=1 Tax=Acorus calamus TaxID=4465 RepID=A0AAV9CH55_ACOCL|nr:hypothetical protein QJS10_CPB19g00340 [Acorus calamus]
MVDDELLTEEDVIADRVVNHFQTQFTKERTWRPCWEDRELPKLPERITSPQSTLDSLGTAQTPQVRLVTIDRSDSEKTRGVAKQNSKLGGEIHATQSRHLQSPSLLPVNVQSTEGHTQEAHVDPMPILLERTEQGCKSMPCQMD